MNNAFIAFPTKIDAFSLVKEKYQFDDALQDKAVQFLKILEPQWGDQDQATRLVTDLVPSSDGSNSGFLETLSFLSETTSWTSTEIKHHLVEADLVTNIIATVQPQA
ncbi:hypothetical protein BLNAU_18329 [Blattamonas nauphoetae]|uniref:Uncharacterized protein n=1 Tax=Blattamonas nauphoetae TaxID=2049346 RepID=A0ABQ9X4P0_9EUKA|nr:hypothetical protein BLNAU_18329 [Blattamonas nauphoetae]